MQIKIPADQVKKLGMKPGMKMQVDEMAADGSAMCSACADDETGEPAPPKPASKAKRSPALEAAIKGY